MQKYLVMLTMTVALLNGCGYQSDQSRRDLTPEEENRFLQIVTDAQVRAHQTDNGVRLDQIRTERDQQTCAILANPVVTDWIGKVKSIDSTMAGDGTVSLSLADTDIDVGTWNNVISDIGDHTIIKKGTKLFTILGQLSKGEKVVFAGRFVQSNKCPEESSLTTDGSLSSPAYIFNFLSIKPLGTDSN